MASKKVGENRDPVLCRYVRRAYKTAMRPLIGEDQKVKVGIDRDQNPIVDRTLKNLRIAGIVPLLGSLQHVVPLFAQPPRKARRRSGR